MTLTNPAAERTVMATTIPTPRLTELPVDSLTPHPDNPRRELGDLGDLTQSIRDKGLLQPVVVVPHDTGHRILAGHRRHAAAVQAGATTIPAIIRPDLADDPLGQVDVMVHENLQRAALTPIEEARAFRRYADEKLTQRQIAARVGCNQSHVSRRLQLLKLPPTAQQWVDDGELDIDLAVTLAGLPAAKTAELCAGRRRPPPKWQIDNARHLAAQDAARAKAVAAAKKAGWVILDHGHLPRWQPDHDTDGNVADTIPVRLDEPYGPLAHIDLDEHRLLDCHALYVSEHLTRECCTRPSRHPIPLAAAGDSDPEPGAEPAAGRPARSRWQQQQDRLARIRTQLDELYRTALADGTSDCIDTTARAITAIVTHLDNALFDALPHAGRLLELDPDPDTPRDIEEVVAAHLEASPAAALTVLDALGLTSAHQDLEVVLEAIVDERRPDPDEYTAAGLAHYRAVVARCDGRSIPEVDQLLATIGEQENRP